VASILTIFNEEWYRHSMLRVFLTDLKGCVVGSTDRRDLRMAKLEWAQML
jgi:hypothetical protein